MNIGEIKIPSTQKEAVFNSAVAGLQLLAGNSLKKPSAKNRKAISMAKVNLAINATPILLPIVVTILQDIAGTVTKLFAPAPIQVNRLPERVIVIGPTTNYRQPVNFGN